MPETDPLPLEVTASDAAKAEQIKNDANIMFAACHYEKAIERYTEAISYNPYMAAYYTNRAFASIKLELYGVAIQDANNAIKQDPKFIKAYYRRAIANMALGNLRESVKDFRTVCLLEPRNQDARKKLIEWYIEVP
jgi:serine/threonine-protein phosphatase 5